MFIFGFLSIKYNLGTLQMLSLCWKMFCMMVHFIPSEKESTYYKLNVTFVILSENLNHLFLSRYQLVKIN